MHGRPSAVLAYIERGLDPDAPMQIAIPGGARRDLSARDVEIVDGQILVLNQCIAQGKAEMRLLEAAIDLKRQAECQVIA